MNTLENIIEVLGYSHSDSLYYWKKLKDKDKGPEYSNLSLQTIRTLEVLNPYAFYCVENKPFVLFFESPINHKALKSIHKKIWNSQIAVAIFDCGSHIEIYNGRSLDSESKTLHLVEKINERDADESSNFSYWNITSNDFWSKFVGEFSEPTINMRMLDNIKFMVNFLKKKHSKPFAVQLTLRLIFIRFLIDRGVDLDFKGFTNEPSESEQQLLKIMRSKDDLYNLFEHLKNKFNGNLFEFHGSNKRTEMKLLDEDSLEELCHFMSGKQELESGQLSFFPMYDFNIIPVELISNIYERLLGEEKQREDSAFYTPPYLVDYILQQTIKPYLHHHKTCKVLDPACGSGIFLVETLRSIIENNLQGRKYYDDNEELLSLLTENIFGVDKNQEAINVAIFSLYLTLLEYKDPKSLRNFKLPQLKNENIFVDDFFLPTVNESLGGKKFDFIIGNPPWGKTHGPHIDYCKNNNIPVSNKEISRSFIARTKDFSTEATQCCLVVTSNIFYNAKGPAKRFREWLLTETKLKQFIELASVRRLIFRNAQGPAAVIFYRFTKTENESHEMKHLTLKPNMFFRLFQIMVIETNDIKFIPQGLLLEEDWAWKTIVFGTTHDYYNIKKLKESYKTMKEIIDEHGLIHGTGIKMASGNKNAEHLHGKKLIDTRNGISAFKVDLTYSSKFNKKSVESTRNPDLFKPPYTLLKKGFNIRNYKIRAAYSEDEFLYRDGITGIAGNTDSKEILLSFTGLLNSSFYAYLNLMLGTSAGIEREQSFPSEILNFPATFNSTLASKVSRIQNMLRKMQDDLSIKDEDVEKLISDLDQYVLSCFNMQDNIFVHYVLDVQIPLLAGDVAVFRKVSIGELKKYVQTFIDYWDGLLNKNNQFVQVIIYPSIMSRFSVIEVKILEENPIDKICISKEKNTNLELVSKFMLHQHNDLFYQMKDIVNFEQNSFYIIKTNEYKNWHPAVSELDLAKVIHSILLEEEDENERI